MGNSGSPQAYKMGTIAQLTGFSPAVLRAWERRHGLLVPERTAGGHRLYTQDDLKVLRRVRLLLDRGRSIGEIAALGRPALLEGPGAPGALEEAEAVAGSPGDARSGGWVQHLVEAAAAVDGRALDHTLDQAFAVLSPDATVQDVLEPALVSIGEWWAQGRCSVAGEHLASTKMQGRLLGLLDAANDGLNGSSPRALIACLPNEQHQLGALLAAYALARRGFRVSFFGAALPLTDLEGAIERLRPTVVALSVARQPVLSAHEDALVDLVQRHSRVRFLLGGRSAAAANGRLREVGVQVVVARGFRELVRMPLR